MPPTLARVALALAAAAASACRPQTNPPLRVVLAGTRPDACSASGSTSPDTTLGSATNVATLRLTVRRHDKANDPGAGSFVCDRVIDPRRETPTLSIAASGTSYDIYGEAFSGDATPQRLAVGAITGVTGKQKTLPDLRLVNAQTFGCLPAGLTRPRAFHSATLLPDGQLFILGGLTGKQGDGTFLPGPLFVAGDAEVYDPASGSFIAIAALDDSGPVWPRAFHQATLLNDAPPYQILVVGGLTVDNDKTPAMGAFTPVFPGTRLVPFDTSSDMPTQLTTRAAPAQLLTYDPDKRTIKRQTYDGMPGGVFQAGTSFPTAPPGLAVAGGIDWMGASLTRVQKVAVARALPGGMPEPARVAATVTARMGATLTPLSDNTALLWGGQISTMDSAGELVSGLAAGGTVQTGALTVAGVTQTEFHTATLVDDNINTAGNHVILVTGGFVTQNTNGGVAVQPPGVAQAVRILTVTPTGMPTISGPTSVDFDPDTTCKNAGRYRPAGWETAVKLPGGRVLVTGGAPAVPLGMANACNDCENGSSVLCASRQAALFTAPGTFARTGGMNGLNVPRFGHTATLMPGGNVLVVGGIGPARDQVHVLADVEAYNPRPPQPAGAGMDPDDPAPEKSRPPAVAVQRCGDL